MSFKSVNTRRMQAIDRRAQGEFGIPEMILMEHAGTKVAEVTRRSLMRSKRKGLTVVFAGGGANGGDGFVTARHLDNWGFPVEVCLIADPSRVVGAARINLQILRHLKIPIRTIRSLSAWIRWTQRKRLIHLAIDALLGTGVSGQVRQPHRSVIEWLNKQEFPVIAVDLPSGLSADTGFPCGVAVKAKQTVTCGLPKVGLIRGRGPSLSGRVIVADISLPRVLR